MAPPFHFLLRSFAPLLRRLGVVVDLELRRHGFYPAGGGEMTALIHPPTQALVPVDLVERGVPRDAYAECLAAALPRTVAQRELEAVGARLGWSGEQLRTPALRQNEGPGNALMATLEFENVTEVFTTFGERGVGAEEVAHALAKEVHAFETRNAALGPHLADQWMLPLALAVWQSGGSARFTCSEMTEHATTNMGVIERFLPLALGADNATAGSMVTIRSKER